MTKRTKRILIGGAVAAAAFTGGLFYAASEAAKRFEPFVREQAINYLRERFRSEVEIAGLDIRLPRMSPLRIWTTKGRGAIAGVEIQGLSLRFEGNRDLPPLFAARVVHFKVDLGTLRDPQPIVSEITIEGMRINIPPKGERPRIAPAGGATSGPAPKVLIKQVVFRDAELFILPRDRAKNPLHFQIHRLVLNHVSPGAAMKYHAVLTNPKPPGQIDSKGQFGPWVAAEPGDTPLGGEYLFDNADLGAFKGIAGTLKSTGEFKGSLSSIEARGEASIPDFRLSMSGNRVPLHTSFEVLVDGTNGNTVLRPVRATLGSTRFVTSGAVIKHENDARRRISLDVNMPQGNLRDLLRLAMKGQPFMEGQVALKTRIDIPPLSGKVREKLILDGVFAVSNGRFLKSSIQDQIDTLSRRGQGQPKNVEIDEVVSNMRGRFRLDDEVLTFQSLSFGVPGANVDLAGAYDLDRDVVDFRGSLRLVAKVSQTMSGWKRWALKPVDPFFAKNGAGTFLRVKVDGTSRQPKFGLDRSKQPDEAARARTVAQKK